MEVILLEKIANLGELGQVVKVKDGYARNFLIPHGKAKRATEENRKQFEARSCAALNCSDCAFSSSERRCSNSARFSRVARFALPCGIRKLRA